MRKGKLGQNDKYIIKGMLGDNKTIGEIALQIDKSEECVQKYISSLINNEPDIAPPKPAKVISFQDNMLKTSGQGRSGVCVMSKVASEIADYRRNKKNNESLYKGKNRIYNIKEDRID